MNAAVWKIVCLVIAILLFALAGVGLTVGTIGWLPVGLAFFAASFLL